MIVEYHACNRCKGRITGSIGEMRGEVKMPLRFIGEVPWSTFEVELCKTCFNELQVWLKGEQHEPRGSETVGDGSSDEEAGD